MVLSSGKEQLQEDNPAATVQHQIKWGQWQKAGNFPESDAASKA